MHFIVLQRHVSSTEDRADTNVLLFGPRYASTFVPRNAAQMCSRSAQRIGQKLLGQRGFRRRTGIQHVQILGMPVELFVATRKADHLPTSLEHPLPVKNAS